jgi:hypothetical protein
MMMLKQYDSHIDVVMEDGVQVLYKDETIWATQKMTLR